MEEFRQLIYNRRSELGLSQRQVGELCGLHQTHISKVEKKTYPNLEKVCMTLGLTLKPADE